MKKFAFEHGWVAKTKSPLIQTKGRTTRGRRRARRRRRRRPGGGRQRIGGEWAGQSGAEKAIVNPPPPPPPPLVGAFLPFGSLKLAFNARSLKKFAFEHGWVAKTKSPLIQTKGRTTRGRRRARRRRRRRPGGGRQRIGGEWAGQSGAEKAIVNPPPPSSLVGAFLPFGSLKLAFNARSLKKFAFEHGWVAKTKSPLIQTKGRTTRGRRRARRRRRRRPGGGRQRIGGEWAGQSGTEKAVVNPPPPPPLVGAFLPFGSLELAFNARSLKKFCF